MGDRKQTNVDPPAFLAEEASKTEREEARQDAKRQEAAARSLWGQIKDDPSPPRWWREDKDYDSWPPKSFADFFARVKRAGASGETTVTLRLPSTPTLPPKEESGSDPFDRYLDALRRHSIRGKWRGKGGSDEYDRPLPPANNRRGSFAKGGMYRGKPHAYAAGGRVTDTSAPRRKTPRKK